MALLRVAAPQVNVGRVFHHFATKAAALAGSPWAFALAAIIIVVWLVTGPLFGFSDTWQLVINTSTTIITFLMVFLIQHTQNADTAALHKKLDELIVSLPEPDSAIAGIERQGGNGH